MQKIDNIEIENFKSIRHQKIEGCKRVNVFIGYPNVGKSNILEALSLFSIDKKEISFLDFIRIEDLTTFFFNGNIDEKSEIKINGTIRAVVTIKKGNLDISIQFDRENYGFETIDEDNFKIDRKEASILQNYDVDDSIKTIVNLSGSVKIKVDSDIKVGIFKYEYKKNVVYSGKDYWSLKHPFGENLFSVLFNNSELYKEVQEIFSSYNLELLFDYREQRLTILKRIQKGIFSVPYNLVADTIQRLVFYKAAILSNQDSVLLFEEPESHMFPPYISKFTNDIIYDENGNQFFITTHSPFVLNDFMDNLKSEELAIYIVTYKKETGETIIHKMNDEDMHEAYQFGYDFFMNIDKFIPQEQHDKV